MNKPSAKNARIFMVVSLIALILVIASLFISNVSIRYFTLSAGSFLVTISSAADVKNNSKTSKIVLLVALAIFTGFFLALGLNSIIK